MVTLVTKEVKYCIPDSHLIIHFEIQQEYRASLTLKHLFGLNNYTGN